MNFEGQLERLSQASREAFRPFRRDAARPQATLLETVHQRAAFHANELSDMFDRRPNRMLIGPVGTTLLDHFIHQDLSERLIDNPQLDPLINPQIGEFPSVAVQLKTDNAQKLSRILQASKLSELPVSDQKRCYAPLQEIAKLLIDTYDNTMSRSTGKREKHRLLPQECWNLAREYQSWLEEYDLEELLIEPKDSKISGLAKVLRSQKTIQGVSAAVALVSGFAVASWFAIRPNTEVVYTSRPEDTRPAPTGTGSPDAYGVRLQQPHTAALIPDVYRYLHDQRIITSEKAAFTLSSKDLTTIAKRLINEPINPGSPESLQDLMRHQGLEIDLGDPFEAPAQITAGSEGLPMLRYPTADAPAVAKILPNATTLYIALTTVKDQKTGKVVTQYGLGYTPFIQTAPKESPDKGIWPNAISTDSVIYFIHPWYIELPALPQPKT